MFGSRQKSYVVTARIAREMETIAEPGEEGRTPLRMLDHETSNRLSQC